MTTNGLICKITSISGKRVVLDVEGQRLEVAKEKLPSNIKEGEEVKIFFHEEKNLAKDILEEILNGE